MRELHGELSWRAATEGTAAVYRVAIMCHVPGQLLGRVTCAGTQKGPKLGLMLCCHHFEILQNFWLRSAFSSCTGRCGFRRQAQVTRYLGELSSGSSCPT